MLEHQRRGGRRGGRDRAETGGAQADGFTHLRNPFTPQAGFSDDEIAALITKYFDLRPGAIIRDLDLRRPIYQQVASYGHFGRDDLDLPWERTDKAEILRAAVAAKTAA